MSLWTTLRHPIKAFNKKILQNLIKEALEHLPELKEIGLNFLKEHKDEFLETVKDAIVRAVKSYLNRKLGKAKEKIVEITGSAN